MMNAFLFDEDLLVNGRRKAPWSPGSLLGARAAVAAAAILRHTFGLLDPPISRLFPLLELTRFIDYYPRVIRLQRLPHRGCWGCCRGSRLEIGWQKWPAAVSMPWYEPEKKLCYCTTTLCSYFHGSVFPTLAIDFYPIKALENCITSFLFCLRNFEFSRPFRGLFWLPKIRPSNSWLVSKTCPKQWRKVSIFVSNLFRCHLNFRRENCYCILLGFFCRVIP